MQIYLETSSPRQANNVPKLPGVNYVAKNWALVVMLKALPLANFSSALLVKYTLVKWVQNFLEIPMESADFSANLFLKVPQQLTFFSTAYQKSCLDTVVIIDCGIGIGMLMTTAVENNNIVKKINKKINNLWHEKLILIH